MYARQTTSEEILARKQLKRSFELETETKKENIKEKARFLLGIICVIIAILVPFVCNGDCSFSIIMVLGAVYFFTEIEDEEEEF